MFRGTQCKNIIKYSRKEFKDKEYIPELNIPCWENAYKYNEYTALKKDIIIKKNILK